MPRGRSNALPIALTSYCAAVVRHCSRTSCRGADPLPQPTPYALAHFPETPSQTAGPYVHIGLIPNQAGFDIFENNFGGDIAGPGVVGDTIGIEGRICDGSGHPAKDFLVEPWQANAAGRYNHPADRQD